MIATSKHNKYVSIPDWFSSSSSNPSASETTTGVSTTTISVGGSSGSGNVGGGGGSTEIPIDNRTIVWIGSLLSVPIDEDKIIIKDGKITTSAASDFWELKETESGSYIYTTYPIVTQQGITMYADEGDLDLPSIYDGLPIDNMTIYWALDDNGNKVLKSVGQSSGGVADSVAWVNVVDKPSWLLDDKIQYTEIEGTPDLSGFVTKSYVDNKFVTFELDEEISGIKTFTNGLKVGESLINQFEEGVVQVGANLFVTGGVTMLGSSDQQLKKNIRRFNASEELMNLGGVYKFEYIDEEIARNEVYKGTHIGLIYQNIEGTSLSKMCYKREDGYGALNYLDTSFISLLAAVCIEHETRLQTLECENKELKKEVEQLKQSIYGSI